MTPAQAEAILKSIEEVEAWAAGLLLKCTHTKKLIQEAGAVSTDPKGQPKGLTAAQLAEISAKFHQRLLRKSKKHE